jgi:ribosomal protein S18 acetylase RimI-like enzyme
MTHQIRQASAKDFERIWEIFKKVIVEGDTYDYDESSSKEEVQHDLFGNKKVKVFIVTVNNQIAGFYELLPNRRGRGSHVANASFEVDEDYRGLGLGKALGEHCLKQAKKDGYFAMQFNYVISTNKAAVKLWKSLGFEIIGTLEKAFRHQSQGLIDAHIMYKLL